MQGAAQRHFDLAAQVGGLVVFGKADANALRAVGRGARGRDPGHFASDGVALRVVRQGDEHVDVIAQVVFARAGNEDAAFGKDGDVGGVESGFFLDGQLDDAGAGRVEGSGNGAHEM